MYLYLYTPSTWSLVGRKYEIFAKLFGNPAEKLSCLLSDIDIGE